MSNKELDGHIDVVMLEASELAEYWTGTLHERIIDHERAELIKVIETGDQEAIEALLPKIENTLALARQEMEKVENNG